jgi:hypothetical protein
MHDDHHIDPQSAKRMEDQMERQQEAEHCADIADTLSAASEALYSSEFNNKGGYSLSEEKEAEEDRAGLAYFKEIIKSSGRFSAVRDSFVIPDEDEDDGAHDDDTQKVESRQPQESKAEVPVIIDAADIDVHDLGQLMDHLDRLYAEKDPIVSAFTAVWKKAKRVPTRTVVIPERSVKLPDVYRMTKNATKAGIKFGAAATAPVIAGMEKAIKVQNKVIDKVKAERDRFTSNIQRAFDGARNRVMLIERELQDVSRRLLACERGITSNDDPEVIRRNLQESQEQIADVTSATEDVSQTLDSIEVRTQQDSERVQTMIASGEEAASMAMDGTVEQGAQNATNMADQADSIADRAEQVYDSMVPPALPPRDLDGMSPPLPPRVVDAHAAVQSTNGVADAMDEEGKTLVRELAERRKRIVVEIEDEYDPSGPIGDDEWDLPDTERRRPGPSYEEIARNRRKATQTRLSPSAVAVEEKDEDIAISEGVHAALSLADEQEERWEEDDIPAASAEETEFEEIKKVSSKKANKNKKDVARTISSTTAAAEIDGDDYW